MAVRVPLHVVIEIEAQQQLAQEGGPSAALHGWRGQQLVQQARVANEIVHQLCRVGQRFIMAPDLQSLQHRQNRTQYSQLESRGRELTRLLGKDSLHS